MTLAGSAGLLLGGIGLFLLGLGLMTDGLKLAAGAALRSILAQWTRSRARGLAAGILITGVVQSSSAVTVATIGFANAGLLSLERAVWVIFGSNVGTTMTGWLVALVGFKLDVHAIALPLVGVGVLLRLTGAQSGRAAVGQAIAGFGVLFLGIEALKQAFGFLGTEVALPSFGEGTILPLLAYVGAGVVLTTAMQSSSAALVIALGAADGGLVTLTEAAAVVIGVNLGTTSTALVAVWGATPTAKRVAFSHVLFNVLTAGVALALLAGLLGAIGWIQAQGGLPVGTATTLAVFHTTFNVLGVVLMWPVAGVLVRFLERRFRTAAEEEARPRHLDTTALAVPTLALEALLLEVRRMGEIALRAARTALAVEPGGAAQASIEADAEAVHRLGVAVGSFVARLGRTSLPAPAADALPDVLRAAQHYEFIADEAREMRDLRAALRPPDDARLADAVAAFSALAVRACRHVRAVGRAGAAPAEAEPGELEARYDELKGMLLRAAAAGQVPVEHSDGLLRGAMLARRQVRRARKAARRLAAVAQRTGALPEVAPAELPAEESPEAAPAAGRAGAQARAAHSGREPAPLDATAEAQPGAPGTEAADADPGAKDGGAGEAPGADESRR